MFLIDMKTQYKLPCCGKSLIYVLTLLIQITFLRLLILKQVILLLIRLTFNKIWINNWNGNSFHSYEMQQHITEIPPSLILCYVISWVIVNMFVWHC